MNEPISTIMTKDVLSLKPDNSIKDAETVFKQKKIHHLPVTTADGKLVGIMSSQDFFKIGNPESEYDKIPVSEVMTKNIARLEAHEKIGAAAQVFLENLFHGLPIVDEEDKLVGIITTHDVLAYLFDKEYPNHKLYWK